MDYTHLECIVFSSAIAEHTQLVKVINKEWANPLGFGMKIKRPPKENKDLSKTIRLYCTRHDHHYTQEDMDHINMESGL